MKLLTHCDTHRLRAKTVIPLLSFLTSIVFIASSHASGFMDLEHAIKELRELVTKAGPGVVRVVSYDESGAESGRGSGFFIDRDGRIITNASVMKNAYSAEVFSRTNHYKDVVVLNRDESFDAALIQVKAVGEEPLEIDPDFKTRRGERVVVIGRSADLNITVSEGIIEDVSDTGTSPQIIAFEMTEPIESFEKSKDGPLFNMSGKVIGLSSRDILNRVEADSIVGTPFGIKAISIHSITTFISGPEQQERLHPAKGRIWLKWITRTLESAVLTGYIALYTMGPTKIIAIFIIAMIIIYIIQWVYHHIRRI